MTAQTSPGKNTSQPNAVPSFSTNQVAALVELARQGTLRGAAAELRITEQGLRGRLLALEDRLGVPLYRKGRGARKAAPLTRSGSRFLPHAVAFLDRARELALIFSDGEAGEVHIVATQYLILYVLIDAIRCFRADFPQIHVRLTNRTERDVEKTLLREPGVDFGAAAPYESSPQLHYTHLFSMGWSLITTPDHPLMERSRLRLRDLVREPLILFEGGSTGRQHVLDAFHGKGLSPRVEMETTNTEIIVRTVEAGLGVSIVPLLPNGIVTKGRRVGIRSLGRQIRPIHSGILRRREEPLSAAAQVFSDFLVSAQ